MKSFIKWCNSGSQEEGYLFSGLFFCFVFFFVLQLIGLHFSGKLGLIRFEKIPVKMYTSAFQYASVVFPVQTPSTVVGDED